MLLNVACPAIGTFALQLVLIATPKSRSILATMTTQNACASLRRRRFTVSENLARG